MGQYTLREAAEITGRSVTTLRRYIRSGRLAADKTPGRFGPEFTLDQESLLRSGFEIRPARTAGEETPGGGPALPVSRTAPAAPRADGIENGRTVGLERVLLDYVPADLYRELALKHEQMLVQYGMIRASGQKLYEFKNDAQRHAEDLDRTKAQMKELQDRAAREIGYLKSRLRDAELELEARGGEISSLKERARTLELLARNAITNESIEQQFQRIFRKEREIEEMISGPAAGEDASPPEEAPARAGGIEEDRRRRLEALDRWLGQRMPEAAGGEEDLPPEAGSPPSPAGSAPDVPAPLAGLSGRPDKGRFERPDH